MRLTLRRMLLVVASRMACMPGVSGAQELARIKFTLDWVIDGQQTPYQGGNDV